MSDCAGLFPRIPVEEEAKPAPAPKQEKVKEVPPVELIGIEDFAKVQLKTAKVLKAEKAENSDKLLKLQLEVGDEVRQIVSGIAEYYAPEAIIGKTIVLVANLKPAVIRGIESNGMLLAAKKGKKLTLVTLDGDMPSGVIIG